MGALFEDEHENCVQPSTSRPSLHGKDVSLKIPFSQKLRLDQPGTIPAAEVKWLTLGFWELGQGQ